MDKGCLWTPLLAVGFGASPKEIGPEFTFGIYMEKALGEPMLIIMTSWGGKNLLGDLLRSLHRLISSP